MVTPFGRRRAGPDEPVDRDGLPRIITRMSQVAFYLGVLVVVGLSLVPQESMPATGLWDKANHTLAYGVLAATGCVAHRGLRAWVQVAVGLLILGALLELAQSVLPGRFASFYDVVANAIGVALGSLFVGSAYALRPKQRHGGQ